LDGNKKPITEANHHKSKDFNNLIKYLENLIFLNLVTQSLTYKSDEIGENLSKIEKDQQERESEGIKIN
jgi:hypothetical protein